MNDTKNSCPVNEPATVEETLTKMPRDAVERIVITGASGFVGKKLAAALVERGEKIRVLVRSDKDDDYFRSLGAEIYKGDLTDPEVIDWLVDGAAGLVNLAAVVSRFGVEEREFWDVHVSAVNKLAGSASRSTIKRFVHCSTIGVLGHIKNPPADEETPFNTRDIYQVTKAEGETAALSFHKKNGLEVTIVRPAVVYGPGDKRMAKLFKFIRNGVFKMIGNGKTLTHPVYIDDLVEGIILAYEKPAAAGRVYILGGERPVTLNEWVKIIATEAEVNLMRLRIPYWPVWLVAFFCEMFCAPFGIEPPLFRRRVDFFKKDRAFSIDRAKKELGYEPKIDLAEGARRTLDWLAEEEKDHSRL